MGLFGHIGASVAVLCILLLAITGAAAYDVDANVALEWGARNGYTIGSLKAAELPGRPRGFVATKDIKEGEVVLEIPGDGDSVININDLVDTPIWDLWSSCSWSEFATMDDVAVVQQMFIAIFLLWHKRMGPSSRFAVYLDCLPGELRLLSQWTQAEMREATHTSMYHAYSVYKRHLEFNFNYISAKLATPKFRDLLNPPLTWPEFAHMYNLVISRDFACKDGDAIVELVQVVEYANHDFNPNLYYEDSAEGGLPRRDIKEGEELTITYGNHSAGEFLQSYGFVPDHNPADYVSLVHYEVDPQDTYYQVKQKVLEEHTDKLRVGPNSILPALNVLRILRCHEAYILSDEAIVYTHVNGAPLSYAIEAENIEWLIGYLTQMIDGYPPEEYIGAPFATPLAEATEVTWLIVKMRDAEREVLIKARDKTHQLLAGLKEAMKPKESAIKRQAKHVAL